MILPVDYWADAQTTPSIRRLGHAAKTIASDTECCPVAAGQEHLLVCAEKESFRKDTRPRRLSGGFSK